jgi:hypothetical protein
VYRALELAVRCLQHRKLLPKNYELTAKYVSKEHSWTFTFMGEYPGAGILAIVNSSGRVKVVNIL